MSMLYLGKIAKSVKRAAFLWLKQQRVQKEQKEQLYLGKITKSAKRAKRAAFIWVKQQSVQKEQNEHVIFG